MATSQTKQWGQGELLKRSADYWMSCVLHAGIRLGVFNILGKEAPTGEEVAHRLRANPRGVKLLLNALAAMKLVNKSGERYSNTPSSAAYLAEGSPQCKGNMIRHHANLMGSWTRLHEVVKTGEPVRTAPENDERRHFLLGMSELAAFLAPQVVKAVDLSDRRHLLDLGGGPGTYAIHFCMKNPGLRATVYDLPSTRSYALGAIGAYGLSERIDFIAGDYLNDDLTGSYDAAWLSHVLHAEGPEECERILVKTVEVLEPGALIMIHDFVLNDSMDAPLFPALFSLNMLLGTPGGRTYSAKQITTMLSRAGVEHIRRTGFQGPNDSGIISGVVQSES